jgi:hypothetical protein
VSVLVLAVGALVFVGIFDNATLARNDVLALVDEVDEHGLGFAVGYERVLRQPQAANA